jgi:Uma2 family endonuclease
MNALAKKIVPRATLRDVEAAPANKVAELVGGVLHLMSRPAPKHAIASSSIGGELYGPFQRGRGGPGGWWILDEPELHSPDPLPVEPDDVEVVTPDLAGWTRERMPVPPETAYFTLAPDWICEVLSKSTEEFDRDEKMPIYAREGVRYAWLVDPIAQTLEAYRLGEKRQWLKIDAYAGAVRVRLRPFDAVEIDLSALWVPGPRLVS